MDKQNHISSFTWTHILTSWNLSPTYTDRVLDKNSDRLLREEIVKREIFYGDLWNLFYPFMYFRTDQIWICLFLTSSYISPSTNNISFPFAKIQEKAEVRRQQETSAHK